MILQVTKVLLLKNLVSLPDYIDCQRGNGAFDQGILM